MPSFRSLLAYRLGAASVVYAYKSHKLRHKLASNGNGSPIDMGDTIIAANDDTCVNGGLCDCLHGIVSAYYVAKLCKNQFRILFTAPFQLSEYLLPNIVDWSIDSNDIEYRSCRVSHVPMMLGRFHATWAEERAFHYRYLCQLARQRGTKLLYTNAHLTGESEFSMLFSELFRPSKKLQEMIDYQLSQIGGSFVGASFRFRNLLGDFSEPNSLPLNSKEKSDLLERCIRQIEILHLKYPIQRILVTSDSSQFCSFAKSLPYVYCVQGYRGHVAYQGNEAVMCSFLDLFLLSKSEGNTLYISEQLYRSGFAETASFIGNLPYREIRF